MHNRRFYSAKSQLYGITVYDREFQTPAFQYGADTDMDPIDAFRLSSKLNIAYRNGTLDEDYHTSNSL